VLVLGRDASRGAWTVAAVQDAGGQAEFVAAELSDSEQIVALAERVGDIDILVNNAGISIWGATPDIGVDEFDGMFAANVRAPYYLVAAFAPGMAARGHGSIVNIGSMAGTVGMPGGAAYGATKAALASMTRSWAAEFSLAGVRVNTVASGPVYTAIQAPAQTEAVGATTIMARAAQPAEIASLIVFLASPKASYITGAVFAADGGRTAI
jgi:NAD(P)-dependent dehydrogenase (short-subunit alcohol dehydrogenase family)